MVDPNEDAGTQITIRDARPEDLDPVVTLLAACGLPTDDVAEHLATFMVAERGATLVATGGLELYGPVALLRSVAVSAEERGLGLGARMTASLLDRAGSRGAREVYLLTMDADRFFARLRFGVMERARVPSAIRDTREFADLCPDSAVVMRREVGPAGD